MKSGGYKYFILAVLATHLSALLAASQSSAPIGPSIKLSVLSGTVADEEGAVIPGAVVELTAGDGKLYRAASNDEGAYKIEVPSGTYRISVSCPPLTAFVITDYFVPRNGSMKLDLALRCVDCRIMEGLTSTPELVEMKELSLPGLVGIRERASNRGIVMRGGNADVKVEKLTGAVVAYDYFSSLSPCYHICGGSLIVRLTKPGRAPATYIRVDFTYPDRNFPSDLVKARKTFRLKLKRTSERDAPLREFVPMVDLKTGKEEPPGLRVWTLLPGAESESLPYGRTLPSYSLAGDVFKLGSRK